MLPMVLQMVVFKQIQPFSHSTNLGVGIHLPVFCVILCDLRNEKISLTIFL